MFFLGKCFRRSHFSKDKNFERGYYSNHIQEGCFPFVLILAINIKVITFKQSKVVIYSSYVNFVTDCETSISFNNGASLWSWITIINAKSEKLNHKIPFLS